MDDVDQVVTAVPDKILDRYTTFERTTTLLASGYGKPWRHGFARKLGVLACGGVLRRIRGGARVPVAIINDPDTAFLILVSDPAMPIRDQGALAADSYLRNIGVPTYLYEGIRVFSAGLAGEHFQYANFDPRLPTTGRSLFPS